MDPLRLLSRSTKLSRNTRTGLTKSLPSSGQNSVPQLFPTAGQSELQPQTHSKKRKRHLSSDDLAGIDFFRENGASTARGPQSEVESVADDGESAAGEPLRNTQTASAGAQLVSLEERKSILKKHKLKITWLNPPLDKQKRRRKVKAKDADKETNAKQERPALFPSAFESFHSLRHQYGTNNRLASNVDDQGYTVPTEVQIGALPLLLDFNQSYLPEESSRQLSDESQGIDLMTVAPTGSGKTLAFLLPLVHLIAKHRRAQGEAIKLSSAVILAPTKELVGQIVNEGRKLALGTGVRISQVRKGMQLTGESHTHIHDEDESDSGNQAESHTVVKADILVSTPGILDSIIRTASKHDKKPLSSIRHLILDEADVLLDPLFREQTLAIWNALTYPLLRVSLWSATMGSSIEELARAQIDARRTNLADASGATPPEAPLIRLVVGLKDSAVPNVQHRLTYAASEQGKLLSLRQLLRPTASTGDHRNPNTGAASSSSPPPLVPPFLVFTQTIDRAVALHAELRYDIPAEAGGAARIAVLHAGLSDAARSRVMAGFRRADIWVLITTDLLSRGVDFRGVNAVVNYDLPTSSAAYVHRAGRTGRAGRSGGVAITLYTKDDVPYLKNVANVVALAQKQRGDGDGDGGGEGQADGVQQWLLDALPSLSKKAKQGLKKHGVEARTARGREKDPKAGRRARISTKAGFVRREENRRKGAIAGSQQRRRAEEEQSAAEASGSDFDGFDE